MGVGFEWLKKGNAWVLKEAGINFRVKKGEKKYTPWRARWYENSAPKTLFAPTLPDVKAKVEKRVESIRQAGRSAITLDEAKLRDALRCYDLLKPFKGTLPSTCVSDWIDRRGAQEGSKLVPDAVAAFIVACPSESIDTTRDRRSRLNRFAKDHADLFVSDLTTDVVQTWLDTLRDLLGLQSQTRDNYRRALSPFFQFCRRKKWRSDNPMDGVEPIRSPKKEPVYFTAEEVRKILATAMAHPELDLLGYFALALFAGIRPDELGREENSNPLQSEKPNGPPKPKDIRRRLDWNDIDFQDLLITVSAETSKIRERRLIEGRSGSESEGREVMEPLPATIWPWLEIARRRPYGQFTERSDRPDAWRPRGGGGHGRKATEFLPRQGRTFTEDGVQEGRVAPDGLERRLRYFKTLLGFDWKPDGLRHSFATYHYARHRNAVLTAHFLGHHDLSLVYTTYRGVVREAEGTKFWSLKPEQFKGPDHRQPRKSGTA
jgi:integrase